LPWGAKIRKPQQMDGEAFGMGISWWKVIYEAKEEGSGPFKASSTILLDSARLSGKQIRPLAAAIICAINLSFSSLDNFFLGSSLFILLIYAFSKRPLNISFL
jgi:hypothetical protein